MSTRHPAPDDLVSPPARPALEGPAGFSGRDGGLDGAAHLVSTSTGLGWQYVHASVWQELPDVEHLQVPASRGHRLVMVTQGRYVIEAQHGQRWRRAVQGPGVLGLTTAGKTDVLRWRGAGPGQPRSVHVFLDPALVDQTRQEFSSRGARGFPDALQVVDTRIQASVRDLLWGLEAGAPPLYADAVAQVLTTQLVMLPPATGTNHHSPGLNAATLARVVEYLDANLSEPVTLDDLALVANMSKYHLLRQFKIATGQTPHQFLQRLRMEHAERLLTRGGRTVDAVARLCGYASDRQFSAAFTRHTGSTPARWSAEQIPHRGSAD